MKHFRLSQMLGKRTSDLTSGLSLSIQYIFKYRFLETRTLAFLNLPLPEPLFGLTVLSYLVFKYSAKLIGTFAVPFTVVSVAFVSLKFLKKKKIILFHFGTISFEPST